ncbi:hypothetical protein TRM7557_01727 [Tritonibacter multivorans]|uniref:Uncharacterized protein n=1 Tax=Tritonibacter multivorans TaxID=928856 RepID=A0A0P1GSC6_9RHOB|nr:hypothetical protein [Tritonibacter multivorans]MDA7422925.1 hypothetical protein [Tritonibacter multivorans]CUH78109.1 hypothetical protein TRM7557_01727 [Tritonibacter multivorans]SFD75380.1 hypothetical protein SAMN04488049_12620 [Tritonibacter multivorans]
MTDELKTGARCIATEDRSVTLDEALLYVAEINSDLAEETGLDLMSVAAAGIDSAAAVAIVRKMGLSGRAYIKEVNGKAYVILKGHPGQRAVLNGTRYLRGNPKVAKLVLSAKDLAKGAVKMTGIAVVAFASLRVVEHVLSDQDPRLTALLGTVAMDVAKFAMAAGAGYLAGAAVGALTTLAAGPIVAAVVIGVGVSILLDRVDRKFGLTESLIRAIEDTVDNFENPFRKLARMIHDWERHIIQQAVNNSLRLR